jgi:membrane protein
LCHPRRRVRGAPLYKKILTRLGLTVLAGVVIGGAALAIVLTGALARVLGRALGIGQAATAFWDIAKWPVVIILISLLFAVLYWAAPSARRGGFRWITPGSSLAGLAWIVASALFALYVAAFGSYNKVYGSVAVVIVFLIWLWISNLAILVGAEFDAELRRSRAVSAGHEPGGGPYRQPRDTKKVDRDADPDL